MHHPCADHQCTGMMHFKWNEKVNDNKVEWLESKHFRRIVCKLMDIEGQGNVSKLSLYTVLGRMDREDSYQLSDAIFEVISPSLVSVTTKELAARLEVKCNGNKYAEQDDLLEVLYQIVLLFGCKIGSKVFKDCRDKLWKLTTPWRQKQDAHRFLKLDNMLQSFYCALQDKNVANLNQIISDANAFSDTRKGTSLKTRFVQI